MASSTLHFDPVEVRQLGCGVDGFTALKAAHDCIHQ